jgi:archaellum component FlaC
MTTESSPRPSFGRRLLRALGWFLRFLLRLVFVLVIGALLGGAIYWGATYGIATLNRQLFQPIRNHTFRLNELEVQTTYYNEQMTQRLQALQERIDTLEKQGDTTRETLSSVQARLETSEALLGDVQKALDSAQKVVDQLQSEQEGLAPSVKVLEKSLDELAKALDTLDNTVSQTVKDVDALTEQVDDSTALDKVRTEVQVLKAMELLTRARLLLAQGNPGSAMAEVQEARNVLLALQADVPEFQQTALLAVVQRLDLSLTNLPDAPRLAADDLEIAWQMLVRGLPATPGAAPLTSPLPVLPLTSTLPLSPTDTVTATAVITATETITPGVTPTQKP